MVLLGELLVSSSYVFNIGGKQLPVFTITVQQQKVRR